MRGSRMVAIAALAVGLLAGTAVLVVAQEGQAPQSPAEFDGRVRCGPPVRPGTTSTIDLGDGTVLSRDRDGAWRQVADVSDSRLEGTWYHTWEADQYVEPDESSRSGVSVGTWRIENEDGAWQGGAVEADLADGTRLSGLTVLVGEGAYEGLTAFVGLQDVKGACAVDIRGLIVEDVPAIEPYRPE